MMHMDSRDKNRINDPVKKVRKRSVPPGFEKVDPMEVAKK